MCGICGFTGFQKPGVIKRMNAAMMHRGPDDEGFYQNTCVSFGMRRLAIVDLLTGKQPITNEDGSVVVVFNGEIYNHMAVRRNLIAAGHQFSTDHSDTEIVVHAYEEYGVEWPEKVRANGMFSIALWDVKHERLLLYRDRMGKKPLYYAGIGDDIVFASEIKSLFQHPGVSKYPDPQALSCYFMLKHISAPSTDYTVIKQLLPGHVLIWEKGRDLKITPYWSLSFMPYRADIDEEDVARELYSLLEDAVGLRMECDVPYGAYLSGGVDSAAVTALMCRHQVAPVKTFCLGYEDEVSGQFIGKSQDVHYARLMAERLKTEHHELIISAKRFAEDMPSIISAFDEPFSGTISTWFLSTLIKSHVKVALSGDGADELFGSYLTHRLAFPVEHWLRLRQQGKHNWHDLSDDDMLRVKPFDNEKGFDFLCSVAHSDQACLREKLGVFTPVELRELLSPEFVETTHKMKYAETYWPQITGKLSATDALNRALELDQLDLLPNQILPFVDRLSMAHSIEVRCPYLDHRIVALANSLPGGMKIKDGVTKYIHKKALQGLLPDDLLNRPKEGFVQPVYSWMHAALKSWTLDLLQSLPRDLFQDAALKRIISEFVNGNEKMNAKVWNLACFALWVRKNPL